MAEIDIGGVERDGSRTTAGHRVERDRRPTCACVTSLFVSPAPTWVDAFGFHLRIEVAILKRNVSF